MSAFRYWRINITKTRALSSNQYKADIADIEMRGSVGGANLATGGTPIASSEAVFTGISKENAFDGLTDTNWLSGQNEQLPQWIGYDFGSAVTVAEVQLTRSDFFASIARSPQDFTIDGSNDGDTWVTVSSYEDEAEFGYREARTYIAATVPETNAEIDLIMGGASLNIVVDSAQAPDSLIWIRIDGATVPCNQIHDVVEINRSEGGSALATVSLIPPVGAQNLTQYQGKPITIDWVETGDRLYTGVIDVPEFDIVGKTITLRCSNNRKELNNALDQALIDSIGQYSDIVFGEAGDKNQQVESRLQTVPASLDYDANLNPHFTQWKPKATADYVIDDCSIYRRQPRVEIINRSRIINSINVEMTYRYMGYRHREREFEWNYIHGDDFCAYWFNATPVPPVASIQTAANSSGWVNDGITFKPLWPSGWRRCGGVLGATVGFLNVGQRLTGVTVIESEEEDETAPPTVFSMGQPIDYTKVYTLGASWTAAKRFTQRFEETININVRSSASIEQYTEVANSVKYGFEQEQTDTGWESPALYSAPTGTQTANGDWLITDKSVGQQEFEHGIICAINRAKTDILATHRQNYVSLQVPMMPAIDLRHTVETTSGSIQCKAKVFSIRHLIYIADKYADTEITLALSQINTVEPESPYVISYPDTSDEPETPQKIVLGNWIGGRAGLPTPPPDADGYFTNYYLLAPSDTVINNPEDVQPGPRLQDKFVVKTPDIDDASRDTREVEISTDWDISINNDLLEIIY